MAEPHPKSVLDRVTDAGIELTRHVDHAKHRLEHAVGLDHHAAPTGGPSVPEKVEKIFAHDDLKPYEPRLGGSQADRDLAAALHKRDEGIAIANNAFDKHVGKSLHVLADPNANVVECAKAFKDLAHEVKTAASPGSLIKEIGTEVLDAKIHTALAAAEHRYPHEFKVAEGLAAEAKAYHKGHELGEKIDKDVDGIRKDLKALHKAAGAHDYAGLAVASKHLYDHTGALHHDVNAASTFVSHEAAQATHAAGQQGRLGHGGPAAAGTFSSAIVNNAPVTPSPLDNLTPNAPATIAHTHQGYEAHTQTPSRDHTQQQQQHVHAGR